MCDSFSIKWGKLVRLFSLVSFIVVLILISTASGLSAGDTDTSQNWGEMPPNDFRISVMGPDGDPKFDARKPAVAYNSLRDEYLVVWYGNHLADDFHPDEEEIYGQRVDASTGALIGHTYRITFMGEIKDPGYGVRYPDVVYNSVRDEYFVVWWGADSAGSLVSYEYEIFGQRLVYNDHDELTSKGWRARISHMGPDGNNYYSAFDPAVAYDHKKDEYLVVWSGDDNTLPLVNGEMEIFGRYLYYVDDVLIQRGDQFRISYMGFNGEDRYDGFAPDVAYNENNGDYLVVWAGDNHTFYMDDEYEIWACLILPDGTIEQTYIISLMGGVNDNKYVALDPAVTYNPDKDEWLIVWWGNEYGFSSVSAEYEIFGQFIKYSSEGFTQIGDNDFRISEMGPDKDVRFSGSYPDVAYDPLNKIYMVVWMGDDDKDPLKLDELEVFGQLIDADSRTEVRDNDFRLSDMGPDGNENYEASSPAVVFSDKSNGFLVVWSGDDNTIPLVNNELEIFGQRYATFLETSYLPLVTR